MELVTARVDWEPLLLAPVGDVQYGAAACDVDRFKRYMDEALQHDAYFIGMGDSG